MLQSDYLIVEELKADPHFEVLSPDCSMSVWQVTTTEYRPPLQLVLGYYRIQLTSEV